jgi:hypothetical protein
LTQLDNTLNIFDQFRGGSVNRPEFVTKLLMADPFAHSITKEVVGRRFGPDAKDQRDMLGSFIRHGLTRDEAESETILQM